MANTAQVSKEESTVGASELEHDDAVIEAYEAAKQRYICALTTETETKLWDAMTKRRDALTHELATLNDRLKPAQEHALVTAKRYADFLPHRVRKWSIAPPSFWERMRTLNAVDTMFREAYRAQVELDDIQDQLRKKRERLDSIEREVKRSIYLREEAVRKKIQTPEGLTAMHADPMVSAAFERMQRAIAKNGGEERPRREISPELARDRAMAMRGWTFAETPLRGVMIVGVARFGSFEYYVLRDLAGNEMLLSADPALEALRDAVVDVTRSENGFDALLHETSDGKTMSVREHLAATGGASEVNERYAQHRASVRSERPTAKLPPRTANEAGAIAALARLAVALSGNSVA